jgi:hypothetical protein
MNGRIYDPTLGRFLQADPFIQYPNNSQSFNRYSYVLNNPLSYTDPSGYFLSPLKKLGRALIRGASKVFGKDFVLQFGNALSRLCGPYAWACSAAWNYEFIRAHGGTSKQALVGAFKAGYSAAGGSDNLSKFGEAAVDIGFEALQDWADRDAARQRETAIQIAGNSVSNTTGGKFTNGVIKNPYEQLAEKSDTIKDKYLALVKSLSTFAQNNPESDIPLSNESLNLIVQYEIVDTRESFKRHSSKYYFDIFERRMVFNPQFEFEFRYQTDTIFRNTEFEGRYFNLNGNRYLAGNINYIGVGVYAAYQGLSPAELTMAVRIHNLDQLNNGEGEFNQGQSEILGKANKWAQYGHFRYSRP